MTELIEKKSRRGLCIIWAMIALVLLVLVVGVYAFARHDLQTKNPMVQYGLLPHVELSTTHLLTLDFDYPMGENSLCFQCLLEGKATPSIPEISPENRWHLFPYRQIGWSPDGPYILGELVEPEYQLCPAHTPPSSADSPQSDEPDHD